jgi:hypothetical protein
MALEQVRLDDVTWAEMVTSIRRRIPAASQGRWTLHAPVDPGVTLLELFAWLLEQRVYWMDQIPPSQARAILSLLGQPPLEPGVAGTVVAFERRSFKDQRQVDAGTMIRLPRRLPQVVFTTNSSLFLLPVVRTTVVAGGKDVTDDIAQGRGVSLLPADGGPGEATITLWLGPAPDEPDPPEDEESEGVGRGPGDADGEWIGILLELDTPAAIPAQWLPSAVSGVRPAADLSFWYDTEDGTERFAAEDVDDGTAGLRRSGVLRLRLPTAWRSAQDGDKHTIRIRAERTTFTAPPRLVALTPNAVIARHLRPGGLRQRVEWLPLPGNKIVLPDSDRLPLAEGMSLRIVERRAGSQAWSPAHDLAFRGPGDRVFVLDREAGALRFGDGITGRIPLPDPGAPPSADDLDGHNIEAAYLCGGGSEGNLGSGLRWIEEPAPGAPAPDVALLTAVNVVAAAGGSDPEGLDAARRRVGASLRQVERAITRADYEALARTTPGVAIRRAHAQVGLDPDHPCVAVPGATTVFIVPDAPRDDDPAATGDIEVVAPIPDRGALDAVARRLDAARLLTSQVYVRPPLYREVQLDLVVLADVRDPRRLARRVVARLRRFLDPLVGGEEGLGWPFGEPLRPSAIQRQAQAALAGDGQVQSVAITLDGAAQRACEDVQIDERPGPRHLVALREVKVQVQAAPARREGLR